jgi:CHAT domain-containing protein
MSLSSLYPLSLAVVTPNETRDTPPKDRLTYAARFPPYARKRRRGYVNQEVLKELLQSITGPATAYFAGHVHQGELFEPASSGLMLANGERLTMRELLRRDEDGTAQFPMPSRVVLAGCSSLGVRVTAIVAKGVDRQFEWFGLAIGVLLAGAHDVICTLFELPDIEETSDFDHEVTTRMTIAAKPAEALREAQLRALDDQRRGAMITPAVWQSYVHICR